VAGTLGMDADPVGRDKVEDARPTDLDGEAGGTAELTQRRFPPPRSVDCRTPPMGQDYAAPVYRREAFYAPAPSTGETRISFRELACKS
jgi:hypothetical protein